MTKAALFVVATPIGNLEDLTIRAKKTLENCDLIAAEDTRHTRKLLNLIGIGKKELISYYDQVERQKAPQLIERIVEEELTLVLVSDAGTPCISDPGYHLVAEAHKRGVAVHPIPGPSAVTSLVSASGLPCNKFAFIGFLPTKKSALEREISSWAKSEMPVVYYETPRRLEKSFKIIEKVYPDVMVCVGRELTKMHEEIKTMTLAEAIAWSESHGVLKGEAVVMIGPFKAEDNTLDEDTIRDRAKSAFLKGESLRDLVAQFKDSGLSRSDLYKLLLDVKGELDEE